MLRTQICGPNAHVGSLTSTSGAGGEFPRAVGALISSVTCWTWACFSVFISPLQMLVQLWACVLVFTTLFTALACPPLYKSILQSPPPHTHTHTHKGILRKRLFSPFYFFFFISVVTCRLSALHRHRNYSSELAGKKKKSLGSSSPNKVLKQCLHLHFILWRISALYCASKREL